MGNTSVSVDRAFRLDDLVIRLNHRTPPGMDEERAQRVEEIVFTAFLGERRGIGHVTVARRWDIGPDEPFYGLFTDTRHDPPRPVPTVFYIDVDEEYQGKGVATTLLVHADAYYKEHHDMPLYSSTNNPIPTEENNHFGAGLLWESLERKGLVKEIGYAGHRRWRFY
mgnify:CR=1 FL=1